MTVSFELNKDDLMRWQRYDFLSQRLSLAVVAIVLVSLIGSAETVYDEIREGDWLGALGWFLLPPAVMSVSLIALLASDARASRMLTRVPSWKQPRTFEFDSTGCRLTAAASPHAAAWAAMSDTIETPSLFLLNGGQQPGNIVPKRALSAAQTAELRELLRVAERGPRPAGRPGQWRGVRHRSWDQAARASQ